MDTTNAIARLTDQPALDTIAQPLSQAIRSTFETAGPAGQQVKDALHGVWLGHPLHPVLTDVPIGAWTTALALDASANGDPGMYSMTWNRASQLFGRRTSVMRPLSILHPLAIATCAPTATVVGSSRNGSTARVNASRSRIVSASMTSVSVPDATLMPALTASALQPPFSLSITRTLGSVTDR